jgi:hypothetical protein
MAAGSHEHLGRANLWTAKTQHLARLYDTTRDERIRHVFAVPREEVVDTVNGGDGDVIGVSVGLER